MGRTLPTSRNVLDALEFEWRDYRRCLRADEQARFDALWQKARLHASAMANQAPLDPMHAVFLSMLLELQREVDELRRGRPSPLTSPSPPSPQGTEAGTGAGAGRAAP